MTKYLKPVLSFLLACFTYLNLPAQVQSNFLDLLTEKFRNYCSDYPREEIYIQTDRDNYIAGEDLWLKVYLIDRQSNKLSVDSKIAYIEVLNAENRPVVQKRIKLDNGLGPGQLTLPDTLSSGNYTLRAYTNWMKNFLPDNCFSKILNVFNALKSSNFKCKSSIKAPSEKVITSKIKNDLSSKGISLMVNDFNADCVSIDICSNSYYRSQEGSLCYLFIQTHGNIDYKSNINLLIDSTKIIILKRLLTPGINDIAVFNASGKFVDEKLFYTPLKGTEPLSVISSDEYKIRDEISLDISVKDEPAHASDYSELSVSVVPGHLSSFYDLADYMIFGSEFGALPGEIIKSDSGKISEEKICGILPSLKSNWINWDLILSDNQPVLKYKRETKYHFLYGQLLNKNSGVPDSGRYVFLSFPGKNAAFQYSLTDKNGEFSFNMPIDEQIRELLIQPEDVEINNIIKTESSFSDRYPESSSYQDTSARRFPDNIPKLKVNYQVGKVYISDDSVKIPEPVIYKSALKRFYGKPDIELVMDDYIKLPVMQEVFFELIPGVMLKNKKSVYTISMWDPITKINYEKPPVMFIDGVVIHDPSIIGNLDPEIVEKIDIVNERYYVGDYQFFGIVNIITRTGDFSCVKLSDYAIRMPYRAVDPVNSFSSPDYAAQEMKQRRIPDFRNTLYWDPDIKPDNSGKIKVEFWSSDYASDYDINIQGITKDGIPVSIKKTIKVQ